MVVDYLQPGCRVPAAGGKGRGTGGVQPSVAGVEHCRRWGVPAKAQRK